MRQLALLNVMVLTFALTGAEEMIGPKDVTLEYVSEVDGSKQQYRLYLPTAYDGKTRLPLLLLLHGTNGTKDTYFDTAVYAEGNWKAEADKRGIILLCPHGWGTTEYRGRGENDVLAALEDVRKRFLIDDDRIVCSGQSMGGTGTTYICTHYPDLFAGGIPLASTYSHTTLLENLRHVPMFYIQGAKDWKVYARDGPDRIVKRLKELKYDVEYWEVPDKPHNTMSVSSTRVLDWALQRKLVRSPRHVTYHTYVPTHARAYWVEIAQFAEPGYMAAIDAEVNDANGIKAAPTNVRQFILRPDPALLALDKPVTVTVAGEQVFSGGCSEQQQIRLELVEKKWQASVETRKVRPYTAYHAFKVGKVITVPNYEGDAETTMGNWKTDMMRAVTGADIALDTRRHFRGLPLTAGQDLYVEDLFNAWQPIDQMLVRFKLTGKELLAVLDENAATGKKENEFLVQVSGCRYAFDRSKEKGARIVESDLDPEKTYSIVCAFCMVSRGDMLHLGERQGKIPFEWLDVTSVSAAWRYIEQCGGKVEAKLDGRVRDAGKK